MSHIGEASFAASSWLSVLGEVVRRVDLDGLQKFVAVSYSTVVGKKCPCSGSALDLISRIAARDLDMGSSRPSVRNIFSFRPIA